MWAITAACLLAPISIGCQTGGHAVVHHPAFDQLEQGCFGYEPTVWRSMAGDCQQAIRLVNEEGFGPPEAPEPAQAPPVLPDESAMPKQPALEEVPDDPGLLNVPRIVAPPEEMPEEDAAPAEKPPAVSPAEVPEVNPVDQLPKEEPAAPAVEPKPKAKPPVVEPAVPPKKETTETSATPRFAPVINGPVATVSSQRAAADALFRTVSLALEEPQEPARIAERKKPAAANLSRFISY